MAKKERKHYMSKGERRNVNKTLCTKTKQDKPFNVDAFFQRENKIAAICSRPHGPEEKRLKEKWEKAEYVRVTTDNLHKNYPWIPRTTIEFAVKTDKVDERAVIWHQREPVKPGRG